MCAKSFAIYFTTTTRTQYQRARASCYSKQYTFIHFRFGLFAESLDCVQLFLLSGTSRLWGRQQGIGSRHWLLIQNLLGTHILGYDAAIASDNWTRKCIGRCSLRSGNSSSSNYTYRFVDVRYLCMASRRAKGKKIADMCWSRIAILPLPTSSSLVAEWKPKNERKEEKKNVERDANGWVAHRCRCQRYRRRHRPKCEKKLDFVQKQIHCWQ